MTPSGIIYFFLILAQYIETSSPKGFRTYESRAIESCVSIGFQGILIIPSIAMLWMKEFILVTLYSNPGWYHAMFDLYSNPMWVPFTYFIILAGVLIIWDDIVILSGGNPRFPYYY